MKKKLEAFIILLVSNKTKKIGSRFVYLISLNNLFFILLALCQQ